MSSKNQMVILHISDLHFGWDGGEKERTERDEGTLLRRAPLSETECWLAERPDDLNSDERGFIQKSARLREQEEIRCKKQRRRVILGLVAGLVIAVTLALQASLQSQRAEEQSRIAFSRELAASAVSQLPFDPELSVLLATKAVRTTHTAHAEDALRRSLSASHIRATLRGHKDSVLSAAFSPNSKFVTTVDKDNTARVWEISTGKSVAELRGHTSGSNSVAFSPDGKLVVTASWDGTARIYPWEMFVPFEDLLFLARTRVTRELSPEEREKFLHESPSK